MMLTSFQALSNSSWGLNRIRRASTAARSFRDSPCRSKAAKPCNTAGQSKARPDHGAGTPRCSSCKNVYAMIRENLRWRPLLPRLRTAPPLTPPLKKSKKASRNTASTPSPQEKTTCNKRTSATRCCYCWCSPLLHALVAARISQPQQSAFCCHACSADASVLTEQQRQQWHHCCHRRRCCRLLLLLLLLLLPLLPSPQEATSQSHRSGLCCDPQYPAHSAKTANDR